MSLLLLLKKFSVNKIYNKDCIVGMKAISDEKIDLVVTDPPFAINFKAKKSNYNRISLQEFYPVIMRSRLKIIMILQMLGCVKHIES